MSIKVEIHSPTYIQRVTSILQIQTCAHFTRYFARIRSHTFLNLHMFNS